MINEKCLLSGTGEGIQTLDLDLDKVGFKNLNLP